MKKTILLIAALLVAISSASAFAGAGTYVPNLPGGLSGKLSTNVGLEYKVETNKTGYSAGTSHNKGTKTYASSSGDAAIFAFDGTNESVPDAPVGTASAAFSTGWSAL